MNPAELAYGAYCQALGLQPHWEMLVPEMKAGWTRAVEAVVEYLAEKAASVMGANQ